MAELLNVLVGLATALIGYVIGRIWQRAIDWRRYRRARLFLGPTVRGGVQVVTSRFSVPEFREPTGVVGGGDALALRELATFFATIGLKNVDTVFVDEARVNARGNLILLGGLDTNRVTMAAMKLLKPNVALFDPGPGIATEVHDLTPRAGLQDAGGESGIEHRYKAVPGQVDYGIVIRTPNPFDASKAMIIIAGAYGHGSWAGVDLIQQPEFLRKCEELDLRAHETAAEVNWLKARAHRIRVAIWKNGNSRDWPGVECIFKVGVFDDRPTAPELMVFRPIAKPLGSADDSSALPTGNDPPTADAARQ